MSTLQDTLALKRSSLYPDIGGLWRTRGTTTANWQDCDADSDGSFLIIGARGTGGRLYTSADGGANFTMRFSDADREWYAVACDSDGSFCMAGIYGDKFYTSANSGVNWTERDITGVGTGGYRCAACDSDGSHSIVGCSSGRLYYSTDSAGTWNETRPVGDADASWRDVSVNSDGTFWMAVAVNGRVWVTADPSGAWTEVRPTGDNDRDWTGCDMDSTGSKLVCCYSGGAIYTSTDSGSNWTTRSPGGDSTQDWQRVSCSSDFAVIIGGILSSDPNVYVSIDSGVNWVEKHPYSGSSSAYAVSVSGDGALLFVGSLGYYRYTSVTITFNECLPIVYGDHSGASRGVWSLPCISRSGRVYCFAGHEVLSVANGNDITIYDDGVEVSSSLYTFDELNDFMGMGNISTVKFTTDRYGSQITAKGMGKPTSTGGATIFENIVDIITDVLTVEGDFTSAVFDATSKAEASRIFTTQGYKAAGVVTDDIVYYDLITEQMASFLGSAYKNNSGLLTLEIDDGTVYSTGAPIIPRGDVTLTDIKQRLDNVINQCPCSYAYNYANGEFDSETDDTANADIGSQGVYGVRKPENPYQFYWCRDLTSVQTMQNIIVDKFARPIYEIEFTVGNMKFIGLDVGDVFAMTIDRLYDTTGSPLYNQFWKVVSVSPDFRKGTMRFRALQTPSYMTTGGVRDTMIY